MRRVLNHGAAHVLLGRARRVHERGGAKTFRKDAHVNGAAMHVSLVMRLSR
jgi:hypothetical protein